MAFTWGHHHVANSYRYLEAQPHQTWFYYFFREYCLRNDSLIFFPIGCIVTSAMGEDVWRDVRTVCSSLAAEPGWPACARARC
jgi:hypothetical protein